MVGINSQEGNQIDGSYLGDSTVVVMAVVVGVRSTTVSWGHYPYGRPYSGDGSRVRSGQARSGQVKAGRVTAGQVKSGNVRLGQVMANRVRIGKVRAGQVRSGHNKSSQGRSGYTRLYLTSSQASQTARPHQQ